MKFIESFTELKNLPSGTKVNVFKRGNYESFIVIGTIRKSTGFYVANGLNLSKSYSLYDRDFKENTYTTEYNNKEAGELMIKQLKEYCDKEVKDIQEVYIDK